jgi:hypothetical protein
LLEKKVLSELSLWSQEASEKNLRLLSFMAYFSYRLKSKTTNKYYTGIYQNPETRLIYHITKEKGFTSRYRPNRDISRKLFF